MGYSVALQKVYDELNAITEKKKHVVSFMADNYDIDIRKKTVFTNFEKTPALTFISILILHYLRSRLRGLPRVESEWMSFQQLIGGQGYYAVFKKRVIDRLVKKHGDNPEALFGSAGRFKPKKVQLADTAIAIEVFDGVPILIELWHADEEFDSSADLLFDRSIKDIFCTEDIVVLSEYIVLNI